MCEISQGAWALSGEKERRQFFPHKRAAAARALCLEVQCAMDTAEFARSGVLLLRGFLSAQETQDLQAWSLELPLVPGVQVTFEKGAITRCENFVHLHAGFARLAATGSRLAALCGQLFGDAEGACLVKEKLNYKPAGGAGFLPHLDHPSLAFYLPPRFDRFITVMVAIDDMTRANGCLRVARGDWTAATVVSCVPPEGDPEVGGRAGGIAESALAGLQFEDVECKAGDVLCFNGFVPHRSAPNGTFACRRAVFFTYNPAAQGDVRTQYYQSLTDIRDRWKQKLCAEIQGDYNNDLQALASIPSTFDRSRYAPLPSASTGGCSCSSSDTEHEMDVDSLF